VAVSVSPRRGAVVTGARSAKSGYLRTTVGLITVLAAVGVVLFAAFNFRGGFTDTVPVTVISSRAEMTSRHPMMNDSQVRLSTAAAMALTIAGLAHPSVAGASTDSALNGRFTATSNGDWAMTNDIYRDEATVVSAWTISSTCTTPQDCTGTVTTDNGWAATIHKSANTWIVDRDLPNWEPCPDGSTAPGRQQYRFYRVDDSGQIDLTNQSMTLAGIDRTSAPSGACGRSLPLVIQLPFRLDRTL
jgi:hypothetical protein